MVKLVTIILVGLSLNLASACYVYSKQSTTEGPNEAQVGLERAQGIRPLRLLLAEAEQADQADQEDKRNGRDFSEQE